jgi:zinc protease
MSLPHRCRRTLPALLLSFALVGLAPLTPAARGRDDKPAKEAEGAALKAAAAFYEGVRVETLDNGLRVYLKPIPRSPVVTTMVAYKVGSCDEDLDNTGLSHYLEHLMFKGTDKIKPGDIDRATFRNGGANNAYTGEDYTIYHFDFPFDRWEVALEIEADRMRNLRIDEAHEFKQEKGAVINELNRNEDEPWDLEQKAILPLLFGKTSPYGHPVIGETKHVEGATAEIIKAHYDKWYHPNNAALVVCGGFDPDKALATIKKLFGPIPKGKLPERKKVSEEKSKRPARLQMDSKFSLARLLLGYNTVRNDHPDYYALNVLEGVFNFKSGRLYKKLVEGAEVATSATASNMGGRYPGWFAFQVELLPGKDRAGVEKLVLAEIQKIRDEGVTAAELKRVQENLVAGAIYARESAHGLADSIAQGVTTNDLDYLKKYLPRLLAVTAADVQRVAKTYLAADQNVVVWSVPKPPKPEKGDKGAAPEKGAPRQPARSAAARKDTPAAGGFPLKDRKRIELPNGLVLLLYEDHRLPIVAAAASVRDVNLYEPDEKLGVATLMGYMLDEGTKDHTGPQIAQMIEEVGGVLELTSTGASVRVLTPHRSLALGLLCECLTRPSFPKDAFGRNQERLLSTIAEAETLPEARARRAYYAAVYGKHPNGRPGYGTAKTVKALTPEDLAAFHKKVFVPNNTTIAIVGDFDSKEVEEEMKRLTADWKKAELARPKTPEVDKPREFEQKIITMPEAAQLHFYLGHVGIKRDNPDYYKLLVLDYVLGTGPGFTDRLSARLRDREGLAYTVTANISSSADLEPGIFTCYIGTDHMNFARVKAEFLEELNRIRDEKAKPEEVADAKTYLLGSRLLQYTTNAGVANQLLIVERYNLGVNYLEDFRKAVEAVTPEDVQAVAKKYLDPKRMVLVAAGAIDASGKPLGKAPPPKP